MKKVRLLMVIPSLTRSNGIARFAVNYIKYLNLDKFEVSVLAFRQEGDQYYRELLSSFNVRLYDMGLFTDKPFEKIRCIKLFFEAHHDFDIVHSNLVGWGYFILRNAKKWDIPVRIMHSHLDNQVGNRVKKILNKILIKRSIKISNYYLACATKAGIFMFKNKKFDVINNAIETTAFQFSLTNRNEIRDLYRVEDNQKLIGFVGRITEQKNVTGLIEIFNQVYKEDQTFKLMIVGEGPQKQLVIDKISKMNLSNVIIMAGEISDVEKYYSAFDMLLMPSLYEGLPLVAVEAQINGLPIVLSDKVTEEVVITNNVQRLSLYEPLEVWKNTILNMNLERAKVINSNYDIKIQSKKLSNIYINLMNQ